MSQVGQHSVFLSYFLISGEEIRWPTAIPQRRKSIVAPLGGISRLGIHAKKNVELILT